jgi:predicted PurR-regulated permease PerM
MTGPTPDQTKVMWSTLTFLCSLILVTFGLAVLFGLLQLAIILQAVLTPLAMAGVIACLFSPLIDWLEGRGWSRGWAVLGLFVGVLILGAGLLILVVPLLIEQIRTLIENLPVYSRQLRDYGQLWLVNHPPVAQFVNEQLEALQQSWPQYAPKVADYSRQALEGVAGGVSFALGLIFVPLYVYYFLRDQSKMNRTWSDFIPLRRSSFRDEVALVLNEIKRHLVAFFRGQVLVALCIGVLTAVGLTVVGLKYGLLIGVITGALSIIPYLGVVLSIVPTLILAYAQADGAWGYVALTLGIFMLVQILEGTFISPKIMGDRTGLHPMTIIVAILIWSNLLGPILGALLAVPMTATLKVLMFRYIWHWRHDSGEPPKAD